MAQAKRTCVLIAGMHRSGTSALTRVLNIVGCDLPKTVMGENEFNKTGHWESDELVVLNDAILKSAGSNWYDWTSFNHDWYKSLKGEEFLWRAQEKFSHEYGDSALSVMKDPRICRILPFWQRTFDALNIETRIVIPIRNPYEVATSLARRDGLEVSYGLLLWLRHILDAEYSTRGKKRVFTNFDSLMHDWADTIDKIGRGLDIIWPSKTAKSAELISQFLVKDERHHHFDVSKFSTDHRTSAWLNSTYHTLLKWERDGEDHLDFEKLNIIKQQMDEAAIAFGPIIDQGHRYREQLANSAIANERSVAAQISEVHEHYLAIFDDLNAKLSASSAKEKTESALVAELKLEVATLTADKKSYANEMQALLEQAEKRHATELQKSNEMLSSASIELNTKEAALLEAQLANESLLGDNLHLSEQISRTEAEHAVQLMEMKEALAGVTSELATRSAALLEAQLANESLLGDNLHLSEQISRTEAEHAVQLMEMREALSVASSESDEAHAALLKTEVANEFLVGEVRQLTEQKLLLTARVSDFESELTLSKGELHFLESSLKQKLAELSDTNNDLKRAIAEADDWRAKYSTATDKYAGMELNLNEKTSALEHIRIRHEELEQHVITKDEENKLLKVEIETIKLKISEQEGVKESIVARLREVEGRLVTTEADRLSFLISRDKLIEQIVHENRPLLSLKRSSLKRKVNLLRNANLVDEAWYLNQYPDVKAAMLDPTLHYLQYGKAEGRKPRG
jgi:hypothetical protein